MIEAIGMVLGAAYLCFSVDISKLKVTSTGKISPVATSLSSLRWVWSRDPELSTGGRHIEKYREQDPARRRRRSRPRPRCHHLGDFPSLASPCPTGRRLPRDRHADRDTDVHPCGYR